MAKKTRIAIIGAGGFAREVEWLIRDINSAGKGELEFVGYVVSDLRLLGEHDSREQVRGDFSWLEENQSSVDALACGIGTPAVRNRVSCELEKRFPNLGWPALVHPSARMDFGSCKIDRGALVCAGVIGTINVHVDAFVLVNLSCTIGHEAVLGAGSVLNPTVNISGGVTVGSGVLIGTGAQVLQYVNIGDGATVGAGAVVTKDVLAGTTVVGVPAKVLSAVK